MGSDGRRWLHYPSVYVQRRRLSRAEARERRRQASFGRAGRRKSPARAASPTALAASRRNRSISLWAGLSGRSRERPEPGQTPDNGSLTCPRALSRTLTPRLFGTRFPHLYFLCAHGDLGVSEGPPRRPASSCLLELCHVGCHLPRRGRRLLHPYDRLRRSLRSPIGGRHAA